MRPSRSTTGRQQCQTLSRARARTGPPWSRCRRRRRRRGPTGRTRRRSPRRCSRRCSRRRCTAGPRRGRSQQRRHALVAGRTGLWRGLRDAGSGASRARRPPARGRRSTPAPPARRCSQRRCAPREPVALDRGGKRRGHRAGRGRDVEGEPVGSQDARPQTPGLERGADGRDLRCGGAEALGELGDAQIVVVHRRARRRHVARVGGQGRGVSGLERDGGVDHRRSRQRPSRASAGRNDGSAADAHDRAHRALGGQGSGGNRGETGRQQHNRRGERGGETVDNSGVQDQIHGGSSSGWRATPSRRAACCQGSRRWCEGADRGAVSRMNRSRAATTAAASSSEAPGATIESFGRRFIALPKVSSAWRVTFTGS